MSESEITHYHASMRCLDRTTGSLWPDYRTAAAQARKVRNYTTQAPDHEERLAAKIAEVERMLQPDPPKPKNKLARQGVGLWSPTLNRSFRNKQEAADFVGVTRSAIVDAVAFGTRSGGHRFDRIPAPRRQAS